MVQTFSNIKGIFLKIIRDTGLEDERIYPDLIEWAGEALGFIGYRITLNDVYQDIAVENYSSPLPVNYVSLISVDEYIAPGIYTPLPLGDTHSTEKGYYIRDGYIYSSVEEGTIRLGYKGWKVDTDGFPMIPDHPSFSEAIKWYTHLRLAERGIKHPAGLPYDAIESRWRHYAAQAKAQITMPSVEELDNIATIFSTLIHLPLYSRVSN